MGEIFKSADPGPICLYLTLPEELKGWQCPPRCDHAWMEEYWSTSVTKLIIPQLCTFFICQQTKSSIFNQLLYKYLLITQNSVLLIILKLVLGRLKSVSRCSLKITLCNHNFFLLVSPWKMHYNSIWSFGHPHSKINSSHFSLPIITFPQLHLSIFFRASLKWKISHEFMDKK